MADDKPCGIPSMTLGPCDQPWGHDGDMHASCGDGFYARVHDGEHVRRQRELEAGQPPSPPELAATATWNCLRSGCRVRFSPLEAYQSKDGAGPYCSIGCIERERAELAETALAELQQQRDQSDRRLTEMTAQAWQLSERIGYKPEGPKPDDAMAFLQSNIDGVLKGYTSEIEELSRLRGSDQRSLQYVTGQLIIIAEALGFPEGKCTTSEAVNRARELIHSASAQKEKNERDSARSLRRIRGLHGVEEFRGEPDAEMERATGEDSRGVAGGDPGGQSSIGGVAFPLPPPVDPRLAEALADALAALEATRWHPSPDLTAWSSTPDGHNHAHVMLAMCALRSARPSSKPKAEPALKLADFDRLFDARLATVARLALERVEATDDS